MQPTKRRASGQSGQTDGGRLPLDRLSKDERLSKNDRRFTRALRLNPSVPLNDRVADDLGYRPGIRERRALFEAVTKTGQCRVELPHVELWETDS